MDLFSFLPWIIFFVAGMFYILYQSRKSKLSDNESYYFANRGLNVWLLAGTLLATQVGGGMLIGVCDLAYQDGLIGFLYPLGQIIGIVVVFSLLSKPFQNLKLQTAPEVFTRIYQLPKIRKCASLISSFSLFIILIAQVVAIRKLLISIGFDSPYILIGIWFSVVAYTSLGGFGIVVKTDLLQIALIALGCVILLFNLPKADAVITLPRLLPNSINKLEAMNMLIWPCCYLLIEQDMLQRFVSAKNINNLKQSLWLTCIGLFLIASVPVFIGLLAKGQMPALDAQSSVLLSFTKLNTTAWVYSMTIFVILMAILSTVDSILCALSSLIVIDKLLPLKFKRNYLFNSSLTAGIGALALIGSYFAESVLKTLVFSYGLTASSLCIPIVLGILGGNKSNLAAKYSFGGGLVSYGILMYFLPNYSLLAIFVSGLGYVVGYIKDTRKIVASTDNPKEVAL